MSNEIICDGIWTILQETAKSSQETERIMKENAKEAARRFQEAELRFQEAERRSQETERIMKENAKEAERRSQEATLRFQETERLIKESDMETNRQLQESKILIDKISKDIGDLGNRLGEFVEYMVKPAVVRLFKERGIAVHQVHQQVTADRNGRIMEIDLLVVNDGAVIAVECKSALTVRHVAQHIKRLRDFKEMFPTYANMKLYGAVAGMVLQKTVPAFAEENGIFLLTQNGSNIEIASRPGFLPTEY